MVAVTTKPSTLAGVVAPVPVMVDIHVGAARTGFAAVFKL